MNYKTIRLKTYLVMLGFLTGTSLFASTYAYNVTLILQGVPPLDAPTQYLEADSGAKFTCYFKTTSKGAQGNTYTCASPKLIVNNSGLSNFRLIRTKGSLRCEFGGKIAGLRQTPGAMPMLQSQETVLTAGPSQCTGQR